jgi:hypothetical protein
MEIAGVIERVERIAVVRADPAADAVLISSGLVAIREARAWLDAQQAGLVTSLRQVESFAEKTIAEAAKTSLGAASQTTERSATLTAIPRLAAALEDGAITAGHVDAVTRVSKKLEAAQRPQLFERVDQLGAVAAAATQDEFRRRVELEAARLLTDDGMDRLERQRRATRASTWVDAEGMWNVRGRFDPLTGARLAAKLDATREALFAEQTPDGCPSDPIEKQKFLNAHALVRLLDGAAGSSTSGRPEFVAVIDADAPHGTGPVAEFSIPVEVPAQVLATLAGTADVHAVVVCNGVVLHAPGQLDLGRTTRLANRAQRRALRGLYKTCGIPGCAVHYDRCELHHVIWWSLGGRTDLSNLLPICSRHHTRIHNDGWVVELGPNRELTLRLPDGTNHTTGPPTIRASSTDAAA